MDKPIAEDLRADYEVAVDGREPDESWKDSFVCELIERTSAAEARVKELEAQIERLLASEAAADDKGR